MARWYRFGVAVSITALVGCGSPSPDHPASGHTAGSADAGPAADQPARQAPMQTSPLGPTAQQAPKLGASITDNPRATTATDTRAQTATSPADIQQLDKQAEMEWAPREARLQWAEVAQLSGEALGGETSELDGGDEQEGGSAEESRGQGLPAEAPGLVQEEGSGGSPL